MLSKLLIIDKHPEHEIVNIDTGMEVLFAIFWINQTLELSIIKQTRQN